ncbi:LptF/LptG family permease [Fusobacterium sp. PH5-44]|uniref:LptF/LptG family permease n=1 Tax=unclassified Fusobacterium TaxID=2648384 RepID=UPI003D21894C
MKIIDKYILKEITMPVIFGVSLFTFIFIIEIIVAMMESIIVKGISLLDVVRMLSFYLPPIIAQTIPMGMFLGIMITFANFTKTSEATAMTSSGISIKRILKPVIFSAIGVTLFIFFLQESIIPRSFGKLQYLSRKIAFENPVFQLKDKTFIDEVDEYSLYIDRLNNSTGIANGVLIFQKDADKNFPSLLIGNESYWDESSMVLKDSYFYKYDESGKEEWRNSFEEKKIPLSAYFEDIKIKIKDVEAMNISMLLQEIKKKKIEIEQEEINNNENNRVENKINKKVNKRVEKKKILAPYYVEINRKIALPLATIMLSVLGVLLTIGHHRSGKGLSFSISLVIIFSYITLLNVGMVMATRGKILPFIGVWTPNLLLFGLTMFIYKRKVR